MVKEMKKMGIYSYKQSKIERLSRFWNVQLNDDNELEIEYLVAYKLMYNCFGIFIETI